MYARVEDAIFTLDGQDVEASFELIGNTHDTGFTAKVSKIVYHVFLDDWNFRLSNLLSNIFPLLGMWLYCWEWLLHW